MPAPTTNPDDPQVLPPWTWSDLEVLLLEMAISADHRAMVRHLVAGLRRDHRYLTSAGLLREIAIVVTGLTQPFDFSEEGDMG